MRSELPAGGAVRGCELEGCHETLEHLRPDARFCCPEHRAKAWKSRVAYGRGDLPRETRTNGKPSRPRSGLSVTYHKAVEASMLAVEAALSWPPSESSHRAIVEFYMAEALSPAQRARLEARR